MTDEELEALLEELEAGLEEDVRAALTLTANDFAFAVRQSTELTAAAFSVSRIGTMWRRRVGAIMTSLRRIAARGVRATAEELGEPVPRPGELDDVLSPYLEATRGLLNAVGDRLAAEATQSLAEGVAEGETLPQLKRRMVTLFNSDGTQLGPTRAQRIATTEATRAFNAGVLAAGQALTGPERPLVKQWLTRRDERVRQAHRDADGQLRLLDEPFEVGGEPMQYPGDPTAPADLTINCRCIMKTEAAPTGGNRMDNNDVSASDTVQELQSRMPVQLKKYWLAGEGAAKIRWGTPGSFTRCVRELRDEFPQNTEGLCANLYHEATGRWPGQNNSAELHTGAMIALVPSAEDAARMAVDGGEPVDQMHVTLAYLGEAADWSDDAQNQVKLMVQAVVGWLGPVRAKAFGVAHWNPDGDSPAWVYSISDNLDEQGSRLHDVHTGIRFGSEDWGLPLPQQHSPWVAHMTGIYHTDDFRQDMSGKLGPVTFDRIRVAFGGDYTDFPLVHPVTQDDVELKEEAPGMLNENTAPEMPPTVSWSTPGRTALAFENQQTGDGRVFAPGALYWSSEGPWPLQYAEAMMGGHEGAELAGAIQTIGRDGDRIPGSGVLYLTQDAGREAAMLLAQKAPLGVSVDLDDVDLEFVSSDPSAMTEPYRAKLLRASVMQSEDGGWFLAGDTAPEMSASSSGSLLTSQRVHLIVSPDGQVPASVLDLVASAGDPDRSNGVVLDAQRSGDVLMRITRGRVRGATLVTIPAYVDARIVLNDESLFASHGPEEVAAAIRSETDYERVLRHVRRSKDPVGAARLAQFLNMPVTAAQRLLAQAASRGEVVRLSRGLYTDKTTSAKADHVMYDDLTAAVTGAVDLPVAERDTAWDGAAAADRVFAWADGDVDRIGRAFAYRDDEADPQTKRAWKLGYADVVDGELTIIPKGVSAALGAVNGARGGVDIPAEELNRVRDRLEEVRAHVSEVTGDDSMHASAWKALQDAPAFRAEWFREPTLEELPPGGPGVNYKDGRIFGWVAQAGEPHAGYAKKITIDSLGRIDTSHFLRQRFQLDDGSTVKAGAYTMNVGHHRDGAECETSACQFDDTRTVAGIVTVGMNERGMWFSGAAAPWLSEWDRAVFKATQPSYHLRKGSNGNWQLRAVLGVPVPGHSSPLLASAVVERTQLALTAAAHMVEAEEAIRVEEERRADVELTRTDAEPDQFASIDYDRLADAMVAAMARAEQRKADEEAELAELLAMADTLDVNDTGTEGA